MLEEFGERLPSFRGVQIENHPFGHYDRMMNATLPLEVPVEILESAGMTLEDVRLELAVALFRLDRLSMGKAAEFARLPTGTFQDELARRKIGPHYGVEDAVEDAKALAALTR